MLRENALKHEQLASNALKQVLNHPNVGASILCADRSAALANAARPGPAASSAGPAGPCAGYVLRLREPGWDPAGRAAMREFCHPSERRTEKGDGRWEE